MDITRTHSLNPDTAFGEDQMMVECNRGITGENGHQYEHTNVVRKLPRLSHFASESTSVDIKEHSGRPGAALSTTSPCQAISVSAHNTAKAFSLCEYPEYSTAGAERPRIMSGSAWVSFTLI